MILRASRFSAFLPVKAFRDCEAQGRLSTAKRSLWVFIPTVETVFPRKYRDVLGQMEIMLHMEAKELIGLILEECEKYKYATSILCDDGIFIHPEAFGKIVLKLGKRYNK